MRISSWFGKDFRLVWEDVELDMKNNGMLGEGDRLVGEDLTLVGEDFGSVEEDFGMGGEDVRLIGKDLSFFEEDIWLVGQDVESTSLYPLPSPALTQCQKWRKTRRRWCGQYQQSSPDSTGQECLLCLGGVLGYGLLKYII